MKAILISIKPKYVADILNGRKTIEIRKTMPKCELPIDVYIYCTKEKNKDDMCFYQSDMFGCEWYGKLVHKVYTPDQHNPINGKVVAKFTLNKVEEIKSNLAMRFFTESFNEKELLDKSCLTADELFWYLAPQELKIKCCGYAWHIDNLVIFNKPKELSEFNHWVFYKKCDECPYGKCDYDYGLCSQCCEINPLTKAPQSWCYVESED